MPKRHGAGRERSARRSRLATGKQLRKRPFRCFFLVEGAIASL
jgi:hypothetical protein